MPRGGGPGRVHEGARARCGQSERRPLRGLLAMQLDRLRAHVVASQTPGTSQTQAGVTAVSMKYLPFRRPHPSVGCGDRARLPARRPPSRSRLMGSETPLRRRRSNHLQSVLASMPRRPLTRPSDSSVLASLGHLLVVLLDFPPGLLVLPACFPPSLAPPPPPASSSKALLAPTPTAPPPPRAVNGG